MPESSTNRLSLIWGSLREELGDSKLTDACATIFRNRLLNPKLLNQPCDEDAVQDAINNQLPPLLAYLDRCFASEILSKRLESEKQMLA